MKRALCSVLVFILLCAFASCGDKKKNVIKEKVTQEVSAEEGGTISTSDESVSIEVPAEALDSNTKITMTVYETSHYSVSEGEQVMSTVVECEPSGTIFKKPILIKMTNKENIKNQVITAAVFNEEKGAWSYSKTGAAVQIAGRDEAGDPIMMSAGGDPIMLNAAGDPIMMQAGGDPVMLSSAGDPIMVTAAGDPIMNSAAGDPIMMTTGHFTAYTFIALKGDADEQEEPGEDDADDDDAGPDEDGDKDEEPVSVTECGNGIVEEGEECDSGADNGRFFCDYGEESCELCSLSCKLEAGITSYCGDGSIDSLEGETCDDGAVLNGTYAHCNSTCSGPARYCGDGNVDEDEGEICDDGADNDTYGHCNAWCDGPAPYCGDGTKQDNEECDLGENNGKTDCASGVTECVLCTADCHFKCKENYTLSGSQCVADTQTKNCTGLPSSNAQWNTASSITQTWSGREWLPTTTAVYNETASAGECRFKCKDGFFWNGDACVAPLSIGSICTGQNKCYDERNELEICPESGMFYGQDAQYAALGICTPQSFTLLTVSGDKVVLDKNTGLQWQQTMPAETFDWDSALSYCENLQYAGYSDWRLPSPVEISTVSDFSRDHPAFDTAYFPNIADTSEEINLWTSRESKADTANAYYASYYAAHLANDAAKTTPYNVMCVRGNELPSADFTISEINRDTIVIDSATGLQWQKTDIEQRLPWNKAFNECKNLNYAGYTDWRLPNKNELLSLVNYEKPEKPYSYFPDMPRDGSFWSSSTSTSSTERAWLVHFGDGFMLVHSKKNGSNYLRCVRDDKCSGGKFWNGSACVSPCESNPCNEASANAVHDSCTPESLTEFICDCAEGYGWGGDKCLPECGSGSSFPCIDSEYSLIWSSRNTNSKTWSGANTHCETLEEGGYTDWRLPTIDELRTIIVNCPGAQAGGDCKISDPDHLSESDRVMADCSCEDVSGNSTYYSKFGNDTQLWSSSDFADSSDYAWRVYFNSANVNVNVKSSNPYPVRCVRPAE